MKDKQLGLLLLMSVLFASIISVYAMQSWTYSERLGFSNTPPEQLTYTYQYDAVTYINVKNNWIDPDGNRVKVIIYWTYQGVPESRTYILNEGQQTPTVNTQDCDVILKINGIDWNTGNDYDAKMTWTIYRN